MRDKGRKSGGREEYLGGKPLFVDKKGFSPQTPLSPKKL